MTPTNPKYTVQQPGNIALPHVYPESATESVRIDDTGTYQYFGFAPIGSAESGAVWKISRLTSANPKALLWADGDSAYDNVWSDRASLSYS